MFQGLTKEAFLEIASDWYDKNYERVYEVYLRKGKTDSMRIPSAKNVLDEYYGDSAIWKSYKQDTQLIRTYRNVIVHTMQIGTIIGIDPNGLRRRLVPKKEVIQKYKSWPTFSTAIENLSSCIDDFIEDKIQMSNDLSNIESLLDRLWEKPLQDMRRTLYEEKNEVLLEKYQISALV